MFFHFCFFSNTYLKHFPVSIVPSFLALQYYSCVGALLVTKEDVLFKAFHSFVVSAIDSVVESFSCQTNMLAHCAYYLNYWCNCMFSGDESLQQVCQKLPNDITLEEYLLFKKFNFEVYVHVDDQLSLRGFTEDSVPVCNHCLDNSQNVESYKFHNLTCPFLQDL